MSPRVDLRPSERALLAFAEVAKTFADGTRAL